MKPKHYLWIGVAFLAGAYLGPRLPFKLPGM